MRRSLHTLVICCLFLPLSPVSGGQPDRPNILVIMSDDMGWSDVGCHGGEIPTPHLDRLAADGLRFTQFYNTGRCCPTRASLLTGLYSHQAGVGHMMEDDNLPGYRGDLNQNCRTIAELLRPAGYRSYISGKWHVARHTSPDGPKHNWPLQRGFDRFYGTIHGAGSFFDPNTLTRDNTFISPYADPGYQPETFYYSDAISDHATSFIGDHAADHPDAPFFLYVAYTAPHWPLHALEEDIARFEGLYDDGCAEEYGRQREGHGPRLAQPSLPPLADDYLQPDMRPEQTRDGFPVRSGRGVMPGPADTDLGYGEEWANVSNTPFRLYKHFVHEGGIASPLIVHWPKGIAADRHGQLVNQPAHLIDIMATVIDLSGVSYPREVDGQPIHPPEGTSLVPAFAGRDIARQAPLFWEHKGNRAIRKGDWKLVARGARGPWELYNMADDRTETHDLSTKNPDLAAALAALAALAAERETWAVRAQVKPSKWDR